MGDEEPQPEEPATEPDPPAEEPAAEPDPPAADPEPPAQEEPAAEEPVAAEEPQPDPPATEPEPPPEEPAAAVEEPPPPPPPVEEAQPPAEARPIQAIILTEADGQITAGGQAPIEVVASIVEPAAVEKPVDEQPMSLPKPPPPPPPPEKPPLKPAGMRLVNPEAKAGPVDTSLSPYQQYLAAHKAAFS